MLNSTLSKFVQVSEEHAWAIWRTDKESEGISKRCIENSQNFRSRKMKSGSRRKTRNEIIYYWDVEYENQGIKAAALMDTGVK